MFWGEESDLSEIDEAFEVIGLRTADSKTYKKINDSYELVLFGEDVHYLKNGVYEEIDNEIVEKDEVFANQANKYEITFPKAINSGRTRISYGNNYLEWEFLGTQSSRGQKTENGNELRYSQVFDDVNLQYSVENERIKEYIEVEKYVKDFRFSYVLGTDLRIEKQGNELWLYNDEHELVLTINEYFMYDAAGNYSQDFGYAIVQTNETEYLVTITPNDDYLSKATYPVIIDPEIGFNNLETDMGSIDVKLFEPLSPYYPGYYPADYGLDYLTVNKKQSGGIDASSKLYMNIAFPSDAQHPGMSNLKNYNFLYAYVTMPTDSASCTGGECTVNAKTVSGVSAWWQLTPESAITTSDLSSVVFHNDSAFTQKFDIYDYLAANVDQFGTNFSLMLEFSLSGGLDSYVSFTNPYSAYDAISEVRIGYSDLSGLYDYYTYEELPSSNSAVSYVAHNSGNLTSVFSDYSDGNLINATHVYNSNRSDHNSSYGYGFGFIYEESLSAYSQSVLRLSRGDGSVTDYAKKLDPETQIWYYLAMDGSRERITGTSGNYTLTSPANVSKLYNSNNKLYRLYPDTDDLTTYVTINYDALGRISQVQDLDEIRGSYNTRVSMAYNGSTGLLESMSIYRMDRHDEEQGVKTVSFTYDANERLTQIKKYDQITFAYFETCNFVYEGSSRYLESIKDDLTNGIKFYYDDSNRVEKTELVIPNISNTPPYLRFEYANNGRKLTITDPDGLQVSYAFDKYFHTKTVTNSLGYSSFTEYTDIYYPGGVYTDDPNYDQNHCVVVSSAPLINYSNLIDNHSFELANTLQNWTTQSNGVSIVAASLYGEKALCINNQTTSSSVWQSIEVKDNKTYSLTGYIENENTTGDGAYLDVTGSITVDSRSTAVKGSEGFVLYNLTFTALSDGNATIYLVNKSTGEAFFDMLQIDASTVGTRYNYLSNASFENGNSGWSNLSTSDLLENDGSETKFDPDLMGKTAAGFRGKTVYQDLPMSGNPGNILIFGGSAYFDNGLGNAAVRLIFTYTDFSTETFAYSYDASDPNLQYKMYKATASKPYTGVRLEIQNTSVNEFVYLDNLAIYQEGYGVSIEYTDFGEMESAYDEVSGSSSEYVYDANENIESVTVDNVETDFSYQAGTDWIQSIESNNAVTDYSRDDQGNVEGLSLKNTDDSQYQYSSSTVYSGNRLYVTSTADEYGRMTSYTYDYLTGLLSSSTFNNITTSYTYDALGQGTSVSQGSKTITFGYDGKMLSSITVDGLVYSFEYNEYQDITAIKIANATVLSNTYQIINDVYSGLVDTTTYGTDEISFTYDDEKRITATFVNEVKQTEYLYDSMGNIAKIIDLKAGVTYHYNYDYQNRLVTILSSDGNDVTYEYNEDGFLGSKTNGSGEIAYDYESIDGTDPEGKNSNQVISEEAFGVFSKNYDYKSSGMQKLEAIAITTSAASVVSSYVYDTFVDGNNRSFETLRIKELHMDKVVNGISTALIDLYYTYDVYGNIATINRYDNSVFSGTETFQYDVFNQLTYHYQYLNNTDYWTTYVYDGRGNITSVHKEQDDGVYSDSLLTFTYQTTGWKDILIAVTVDGVTEYISGYDSAGNPGYYRGYVDGVTFENRNLTALYTPWDEYLYSYNASGIRTSKNINGVVTNFVLEGSKIIKETKAGSALQYYYDSNDEIVGFTYNGTAYVYLKNLQNDIIAIADASGNIIVKYYYDAYGNILLLSDTSGIGLGTKNPFRFKSYYYEEETQFYYLNSRYYDPFTGRFISADDASLLLGGETNIFKYCANNAIMNSDSSGYRYEEGMDVGDGSRHYILGADWFPNCDDLAAAWASKYWKSSRNVEMCAIIFKAKMPDGTVVYNIFETFEGEANNCIVAFGVAYCRAAIITAASFGDVQIAGFIHSHPKNEPGYHSDFPSDVDFALKNWPGLDKMYIASYDHCIPGSTKEHTGSRSQYGMKYVFSY